MLFAPNDMNVIHAFLLDNGAAVWQQTALKNTNLTTLAVLENVLVVGNSNGHIYFLSCKTGCLHAKLTFERSGISVLQSTAKGLLVQTNDSTIALININ